MKRRATIGARVFLDDTRKYVSKNYQWIIGSLSIPVGLFLLSLWLQSPAPHTNRYYYLADDSLSSIAYEDSPLTCKTSLASNRGDAVRCSSNDRFDSASIIDPCFLGAVSQSGSLVSCPLIPSDREKLRRLKAVERDDLTPKKDSFPWYVSLTDSTGCRYFSGGASAVADGRFDYVCNDSKTYLSLPMDQTHDLWSIRCTDESHTRLEYCSVKEVWF